MRPRYCHSGWISIVYGSVCKVCEGIGGCKSSLFRTVFPVIAVGFPLGESGGTATATRSLDPVPRYLCLAISDASIRPMGGDASGNVWVYGWRGPVAAQSR